MDDTGGMDRGLRRHAPTGLLVAAALTAAACTAVPNPGGDSVGSDEPGMLETELSSASLSRPGAALVGDVGLDDAPRYDLRATVEPETGEIDASMVAELPVATGPDPLRFRVFANLPAFGAGFVLDEVTAGGETVEFDLDRSLLTLEVPDAVAGDTVTVELDFSYTIPTTNLGTDPFSSFAGNALDPAEIGLLGRHDGGASLGHWFPVWMTPAATAEPEPDGFGDIANFPAASFSAVIDVPADWQIFTGGKTVERRVEGERAVYREEGVGLRDLSVYAGRDVETTEVDVDGVTIRAVSQAGHADVLPEVGEEAASALRILANAFGPYPWAELDVIDVPLGSGVGGMEWPGAIWIETATFGGGIPGLAGLEGLFGDGGLGELFGDAGILGGEGGLTDLLGGEALGNVREFIVAHEVAHQWWHALVGNDSISAPVVDEPLAQFSACHYLRARSPEDGEDQCAFHTEGQYQASRSLGEVDAPANRPTDGFSSSLQYGGVVYGKAPGLFEELRALLGEEVLLAALRSYVETNAFAIAGPDDLRDALVGADPAHTEEVGALWERWFEEAHGDDDIGPGSGPGGLLGGLSGLGGLGGLEGLGGQEGTDLPDGSELLGGLEGLEGLDIEELEDVLRQLLEGLGQD